jgi:hypothetical protein
MPFRNIALTQAVKNADTRHMAAAKDTLTAKLLKPQRL